MWILFTSVTLWLCLPYGLVLSPNCNKIKYCIWKQLILISCEFSQSWAKKRQTNMKFQFFSLLLQWQCRRMLVFVFFFGKFLFLLVMFRIHSRFVWLLQCTPSLMHSVFLQGIVLRNNYTEYSISDQSREKIRTSFKNKAWSPLLKQNLRL